MEPQAEAAECPSCGSGVSLEAAACPTCGQAFADAAAPAETISAGAPVPRAGLREKFLFYIGIFLILLGGPGIALGSWLHDVLRVSVGNYNSFDVFGPVNRLVVALGLIVMVAGVVCFILSLRLSRPIPHDPERGEAEEPEDAAL